MEQPGEQFDDLFSHLKSERVNLRLLQEAASRELVQQLDRIDGSKVMVVEEAMMGVLDLVAKPKLFRERNIQLMALKAEMRFAKEINHIIYILGPQLASMDHLVRHVEKQSQPGRQFHIFFVPRRSCLCIEQLKEKKVFSSFGHIVELAWNFLPLDADVLSMELPQAYRDVTVAGDTTALYQAAIGLVELQRLYGRIPKIYGMGVQAQSVWNYAKQLGIGDKSLAQGAIDQLILLDRSVDLLTPLATQLTYEGLIDEYYGIKQNKLTLPDKHFPKAGNTPAVAQKQLHFDDEECKTIELHSGEDLYKALRNMNFNEATQSLAREAKVFQTQMPNTNDGIAIIRDFVDTLPSLLAKKESLTKHTVIAGLIQDQLKACAFSEDLFAEQEFLMCADIDKQSAYIEDQLARKCELRKVLRLICLQCAAASGFKEKVLDYYKRELVQVYGLRVLLTLGNLEKAGLLYTQTESRAYAVLRRALQLTVDDPVELQPKDISYVHSFYAPLTARLLEHSLKPLGWQMLKSEINTLLGPLFEDVQAIERQAAARPRDGSSFHKPRVVLAFFIGGSTFAEIAALRFLAAQEDNNVEFVVATTNIINKHTFLDSFIMS